ncbi:MAG TPA: efflux RND transporter periplasmic adaptor subunit [Bacteroidota bacterium]
MLAAVLNACGHRSSGDEDSEQTLPPRVPVKLAWARTGDVAVTVTATGHTDALRKEKIFSPVAGRVTSLKALEGTPFREGELMAVIRTKESQAAIAGAEALLHAAVTPAQQAEARRALALAEGSQGTVELRAKFSGVVATRTVSEGELVAENAELFTLVDLTTLVFLADVPLASLPAVHGGQQASVRFTALPAETVPAAVEAVSPQTDPQSQSVRVRLRFPAQERGRTLLKTDMTGSASIVISMHRGALLVPRRALLRNDENDTYTVVTVGPDSLARSTPVTIGALTDSTAEITGGLRKGEGVVIEGNYALADSTRVTTAGPAAP